MYVCTCNCLRFYVGCLLSEDYSIIFDWVDASCEVEIIPTVLQPWSLRFDWFNINKLNYFMVEHYNGVPDFVRCVWASPVIIILYLQCGYCWRNSRNTRIIGWCWRWLDCSVATWRSFLHSIFVTWLWAIVCWILLVHFTLKCDQLEVRTRACA